MPLIVLVAKLWREEHLADSLDSHLAQDLLSDGEILACDRVKETLGLLVADSVDHEAVDYALDGNHFLVQALIQRILLGQELLESVHIAAENFSIQNDQ